METTAKLKETIKNLEQARDKKSERVADAAKKVKRNRHKQTE